MRRVLQGCSAPLAMAKYCGSSSGEGREASVSETEMELGWESKRRFHVARRRAEVARGLRKRASKDRMIMADKGRKRIGSPS